MREFKMASLFLTAKKDRKENRNRQSNDVQTVLCRTHCTTSYERQSFRALDARIRPSCVEKPTNESSPITVRLKKNRIPSAIKIKIEYSFLLFLSLTLYQNNNEFKNQ